MQGILKISNQVTPIDLQYNEPNNPRKASADVSPINQSEKNSSPSVGGGNSPDGASLGGSLKIQRNKSSDQTSNRRRTLVPRASFYSQAEIFDMKGKREEEEENERFKQMTEGTPLREGEEDDHQEDESADEIQVGQADGGINQVMILWENVLHVSIIYNCVTFCYFLGLPGFPTEVWLYLEFIVEVVMIIDIFIRYILRRFLVNQRKTLNLLHSKYDDRPFQMCMFILSSLPTSIFIYPSISQDLHFQIWPAFIRGLKLYRIKQLNLYYELRDIRAKKDSFIRTFQATLYILLVTHLLSCFWLFIARVDPQQDLTWQKLVLYDQYEGHVPNIQKYIDSVFFVVSSMTGLGFAYIYPRTDLEYAMQSMIMVLGVSTYANFFAFFAVTIYNRNKSRIDNMMRFEEAKRLAMLRGFPQPIRLGIREFYNNLRLKFESMTSKFQMMSELPSSLRSEMSLYLNTDLIQKINFFQFADPSLILKLSKCMYPELGLMDSFVVQQGEVATSLYFIKSGIVQVLATDKKTVIALMTEGGYFGEIGLFLTSKRSCSIRAKTVSVLFTISKEDLLEALKEFPLHLKYLKAVGKQRLKTTDPQDILEDGVNQNQMAVRLQQEVEIMKRLQDSKGDFEIESPDQGDMAPHSLMNGNDQSAIDELYEREIKWYLTQSFKDIEYFIIIPFSKLFILWSAVFCLAYGYDILFVPFSIGLDFELQGYNILIDIASILIMAVDSGMRPFLAINKRNEIEINRKKLFREYVQLYFILDILATIPLDYLFMIIEVTPVMKYFRLLRLLKLYRIFELSEIIRQHTTLNIPLFRISQLFVSFLVIAHWFNCLLLYAARWELYQERRFDGKTLLEWLQKSSSTHLPPLDQWTPWDLYFNLLILATCYMGSIVYGDIIPFTISEEVISIFEMLIGRIFISFLFAEMANYVSQQWSAYDEHIHQQGIVQKWTQLNGINKNLRERIQKYFDFKWHNKKGIREDELIQDLPTSLKKNVKNFIFDDLIQNCDVFPRESVGAISTITEKLQRKLIPKEEYIIRQGELAQEMFFIMKGEVNIVTQEGVVLATLKKHMHFGEMALIQEQISVRNTSAIASTNVICAVLTVNDFKLICTHYPEFSTRMQEIVEQRAKDSLKKGVKVTNYARRPTVKIILQNLSNNRGITQSDLLVHQATQPMRNEGEDGGIGQLSMIEEESKRYSAVEGHDTNDANFISPRTINSARKQAYKRRQSEFGLKKKVCVTRLSQIEDSSDTSEEDSDDLEAQAAAELARRSSKKKKRKTKKKTLESDKQAFPKVDQNQLEEDFEASSNTHSSYLSDSERKEQEEEEQKQHEMETPGDIIPNTEIGNEPFTEQDQLAQNEIFQRFDSFNPKITKHEHTTPIQPTPNTHADGMNSQRSENLQTNEGLIEKKSKPQLSQRPTLEHPGKLSLVPEIGSSMSQLEEYMQQFKGSQSRLKFSFLSMFFFYAYKYILVFPLSLYNIVFIPLQMGFGYEFKGWYLFIEILTILTYSVDIFFICRQYFSLRREMRLANLPIGSQEFEIRMNHDKDEVELKLKNARFDLITSITAMIPFSLIFQGVDEVLFIVNFLRVLRLIKLQPLYRVLNYLKRFSVSLIRLLEIIIAYYVVAHIIACVMLSIGYAQKHDIENTWMNKMPIPLPDDMPKQTNIDNVDHSTVYIHAIYFSSNTISHVAVGDLTSVSTSERALNAFIVWCLTFFYALLFANISSVFSGGNYFLSFNQKYQHVLQTIPKEKLNKGILHKINIYYEHLWSITQGFDEENDILRPLPSQIMYEAFRERYLESIENSIIFKTIMGTTDLPVLNSFIELVQMKVYMPREFIIKAGSYGNSMYFILEGDAVMIGLGNDIFGILKSGSHYNIDIGSGDNSQDIYYGKRIFHLVSQTQTTVAVLEKENLKKLFDAFPYWKTLVRKLNYLTHQRAKFSLEEFLAPTVRLDPYCDEFKVELETIEKHLNESGEHVYKEVLKLLDLKENSYIEDQNAHKYRKNDILRLQRRMLEQDGNINKHGQGILKQTKALQRRQSMATQIQFVRMSTVQQNNLDSEYERDFTFADLFRCFFFNRVSRLRNVVDFIHMCNLVYIAFSVPFFIAFIHSVDRHIFLTLEIFSIIIQFVAIVVNFRTPVFYYGGYTLDIKPVFRHYLLHGMVYDIFGVLPINLILGYLRLEEPSIIFISLVRLTRMIALGKLVSLFEKLQIYLKNYSILMVVCRAILFLCLLWHWTSCLWFFINVLEYDTYPMTWLKKFSVSQKMLSQQYLLTIYYVIKIVTGVGQSDMIAYNNLERITFILIINIGDALFAIAFGLFAEVQHHIFENSEFQQYLQKLKEVEHFLVSVNAEDRQRSRVESFFQYNYNTKRKQLLVEVKDLKDYLPYSLLNEVIFSAYKDILLPVFNELKSENLMKELSIVLQNTIYMPGDYIIQTDQEGDEMYFILEGFVQVISSDQSTVLATLSKGQCFGEISIFMKIKRIAFVQAKTFCIISILKKGDIDKIILSYPSIQILFKKQAKQRLEDTLKIEEQRFNRAKQQEQDSFDESFANALMNANGNSNPDDVSDHTDNTHLSLVNVMRQNAGNQPELNNFIQRVSQSRMGAGQPNRVKPVDMMQVQLPSLTKESSMGSSTGSNNFFRLDSLASPTLIKETLLVPQLAPNSRRGSQRKSILMIPPPPAGTLSTLAFRRKSQAAFPQAKNIEVTPFISVEEFKASPRMERRTFNDIIQEDDEAVDMLSSNKGGGLSKPVHRKQSKSSVLSPNERHRLAQNIEIQELSSSSNESEKEVLNFINDSLTSHASKKSSKDRSDQKQSEDIKVLAPSSHQLEMEDYLQHATTPGFLNIPGNQRSSTKMRRHSSFIRADNPLVLVNFNENYLPANADDHKFTKSPPQRDSNLPSQPGRERLFSDVNIMISPDFIRPQPPDEPIFEPNQHHFLSPNSHINRGNTLTQLALPDQLRDKNLRPSSASRRNTVAVAPASVRGGGFAEDLLPQKLNMIQQMGTQPINDKRRQSVFLFKQAMETIQEDPSDSKSGRARGTAMRMKSKKPVQRRLSKIQLGKNLMLSKSSGLKLQWTVGF